MKVKVLATVMAAAFVMAAVGSADAGHKKCCRTYTHKSSCKTTCCKTVTTCCSKRPNCCTTPCGTTSGCAPAAGSEAAPESKDVETIPAPPTKDTTPPKPGKEAKAET